MCMHCRLISVTSYNKFTRSHETIQFPPLTERIRACDGFAFTTLAQPYTMRVIRQILFPHVHTRFMYTLHIVTCWTDSGKKKNNISILDLAICFPPSCLFRSVPFYILDVLLDFHALYFIFDAHHQISAVRTCFKFNFDYTWFIALLPCEERKKRIASLISVGIFIIFHHSAISELFIRVSARICMRECKNRIPNYTCVAPELSSTEMPDFMLPLWLFEGRTT